MRQQKLIENILDKAELPQDQTEDLFLNVKQKRVFWKKKFMGHYIKEKEGITIEIPRMKSKHLFRNYNSWGINELFLRHLIGIHVKKIIVREDEENVRYLTTPLKWLERGFLYQHPDYEAQRHLPLDKFEVVKK